MGAGLVPGVGRMIDIADIQGFFDAANELRTSMGSDCVFHIPNTQTWPSGTKLNPTTGRPYDATVVQSNARFADITKTVLIIEKQGSPLRPQADPTWSQAGRMEGMDIILDISGPDWGAVLDASEFTISGQNYKLVESKPFELANTIYRWLVYGQEK